MKLEIKKIFICLLISVIAIFMLQTISKAAGFSVAAGNSTLNVGGTTSLTINASGCIGKFTITSSDTSVVSVSESSKWIEDASASITLTANKAGKATITVTASNVSDTSGDNEVTGKQTVTITVSEPTPPPSNDNNNNNGNNGGTTSNTKSGDNSLKSLTVGTKKYANPSKNITASSVSSKTSSIAIKAEANNSKAKISGTGTKELTTGTNKFTISVTAENGSVAKYVVKITRLAEENDNPNVVDNTPAPINNNEEVPEVVEPELRITSLEVVGIELTPLFNSEVFEYSIFLSDEEEITVNAIANVEGATIDVIGNTGLIEGENTIIVRATKGEKVVEYKIIANKSATNVIEDTVGEIKQDDDNNRGIIGSIKNWWNKSGPMSIVFTITLALLGTAIIFAVVSYKYSNSANTVSKHGRASFMSNDELFKDKNKF